MRRRSALGEKAARLHRETCLKMSASRPLIKAIHREFHFLAVAVEASGKELEKAGEAEQRASQGRGGKANASRPFAVFAAVGKAQDNLSLTQKRRPAADA